MSVPDPAVPPIADLRRAAEVLEACADPAAGRFAARLRQYVGRRGKTTLDHPAGLVPAPGQSPWWGEEKQRRRDAAIRAVREQYFPDLKITPAAKAVATLGRNYEASAGRAGRAPDASRPLLAEVVRLGGFPGQRRIQDILSSETPSIHCLPSAGGCPLD